MVHNSRDAEGRRGEAKGLRLDKGGEMILGNFSESVLEEFVRNVPEDGEGMNGIQIISKNGVLSDYHWHSVQSQNFHSIAKTLVSIAVGFAIEEGLLRLEDHVLKLFPEYVGLGMDDAHARVTLHHLLSMSIGHRKKLLMMGNREKLTESDWLRICLEQEVVDEPGKAFLYSNAGPYMAGLAIQKKSGMSLEEFLRPRLLEPLQIQEINWEKDPNGYTFGAGGLTLAPADFAKLAQFCLQKGEWEGSRILSKEWLTLTSEAKVPVGNADTYATHYGYGFWVNETKRYYRADGAFGQIILILPKKEIAIAVHSKQADNQRIMEYMERWMIPSL